MPPRLQRVLLQLLKYEIDLLYAPCSKFVPAGTLSRIPSQEHPDKGTTDVEVHALGVISASVRPATLSRLQAATAGDSTLQDVISSFTAELKSFTAEFSVVNGILLNEPKKFYLQSCERRCCDECNN